MTWMAKDVFCENCPGVLAKHRVCDRPAAVCDACQLKKTEEWFENAKRHFARILAVLLPGDQGVSTWEKVTDDMIAEVKRLQNGRKALTIQDVLAAEATTINTARGPRVINGIDDVVRIVNENEALRREKGTYGVFPEQKLRGPMATVMAELESGPGLAAKYTDATKGGAGQEPVTCHVGADWED